MAVLRGTSAVLTKASGDLDNVKVHAWVLRMTAPRFDVTGDTDINPVVATGDRFVDLQLDCSYVSGGADQDIVLEGDVISVTLKTSSAGDSYQDIFIVEETAWQVDKRGGGPPQRCMIRCTANHEDSSNATATDNLFTAGN